MYILLKILFVRLWKFKKGYLFVDIGKLKTWDKFVGYI